MLQHNLICPNWQIHEISKNGKIHNEKQHYKCKNCGRQFIENPTKKYITQETKNLIDRLLLEKISLAGIARVTNVSETWLQDYVNDKYSQIPKEIKISQKAKGKLTIQSDVVWSSCSPPPVTPINLCCLPELDIISRSALRKKQSATILKIESVLNIYFWQ